MIPTSGDLEGIPIRMTRDFNTGNKKTHSN